LFVWNGGITITFIPQHKVSQLRNIEGIFPLGLLSQSLRDAEGHHIVAGQLTPWQFGHVL